MVAGERGSSALEGLYSIALRLGLSGLIVDCRTLPHRLSCLLTSSLLYSLEPQHVPISSHYYIPHIPERPWMLLSLLFSLGHLAGLSLFLLSARLAEVELLAVLVLLDEEDEVGGLQRVQYLPNPVYHVLQLSALLLDVVLDAPQLTDQPLQKLLLFLKEGLLRLDLLLLLGSEVEGLFQFQEPFIFSFLRLTLVEEVLALSGRPHHVAVQSGQRQVDYLLKVLIDGVDSLPPRRSDLVPQTVDDTVDLLGRVLTALCPLQQPLDLLYHLVPTGREPTHLNKGWLYCFVLVDYSLQVPPRFLQLLPATLQLFGEGALLLLQYLDVEFLAVPALLGRRLVPLLLVQAGFQTVLLTRLICSQSPNLVGILVPLVVLEAGALTTLHLGRGFDLALVL